MAVFAQAGSANSSLQLLIATVLLHKRASFCAKTCEPRNPRERSGRCRKANRRGPPCRQDSQRLQNSRDSYIEARRRTSRMRQNPEPTRPITTRHAAFGQITRGLQLPHHATRSPWRHQILRSRVQKRRPDEIAPWEQYLCTTSPEINV